MSSRNREVLTVAIVILMAAVSFGAGYLVNDLVDLRLSSRSPNAGGEDFSLFWEAWRWVEESYIGELPSSKSMTYGALRGAIGVLNDPYTIFVEPEAREQERELLRGNFGGVGATLRRDEENRLVLSPIAGNPAEQAGIVDGDVLLAVDGREITPALTVEEVAQLIRGEEGSEVVLTVLHPSGQTADIAIVRAIILHPSITHRLLAEEPEIGYIQLSRFSAESGGELLAALDELEKQGAQKLILDLRQNGGGLRDAAVDVSDHFLTEGPILYQISRSEQEKLFSASEETAAPTIPLVVLIDGSTASSAEIVAGALQDRRRATLIGSPTFGKGSVQNVYDLSDGSSIHVTSARWFTPDRHQLDQLGLQPDIVVELSQEAIENGRDEILERAVEYMRELPADGQALH